MVKLVIPEKEKDDRRKISLDLTKENFEKLQQIKKEQHISIGKLINLILEQVLNSDIQIEHK